ncbi:MAG TPA: hypothetical protein VF384_17480 [Planctomycetota bacterium]
MDVGLARCRAAAALACIPLLAGTALAQSTWCVRGSEASVSLVGEGRVRLRGPLPAPVTLPRGLYDVHFGADAAGKPISLSFAVPDHANVAVAVSRAGAVEARVVPLDGEGWTEKQLGGASKPSWVARCTGPADAVNYRVVATCSGGSASSVCGVVARWQDVEQHYRLVWDRRATELRLERQLGPGVFVLARGPAPVNDFDPHTLALQVDGFRLRATFDDDVVLQAFDGAIPRGAFGLHSAGDAVTWQALAVEPPAKPRGSSALVRDPPAASFHATTDLAPGHFYVLQLCLDRPHALVPLTPNGQEPWLLQRPAVPQVLLADWRSTLGGKTIGEVPREGAFVCELRLPLPARAFVQSVLVRALLVSADGEAVVAVTPAVPLAF